MSDQGVHLAVLAIMPAATITVTDAEAAVQGALSANSEMTSSPNDPTNHFQPALAIGALVTSQSGLESMLKQLDRFMGLANLAAEIRRHFWLSVYGGLAT